MGGCLGKQNVSISGKNRFSFRYFSLKIKKQSPKFSRLDSDCETSNLRLFWAQTNNLGCFCAQAELFEFAPEWLHFPFFFSKSQKINSGFHCWTLRVKIAVWKCSRHTQKCSSIVCKNGFIVPCIVQKVKNSPRFPLLSSSWGGFFRQSENVRFWARMTCSSFLFH